MVFEWRGLAGANALPCIERAPFQVLYRLARDDLFHFPAARRYEPQLAIVANRVYPLAMAGERGIPLLRHVLLTHALSP
jgi:hypothetical protein